MKNKENCRNPPGSLVEFDNVTVIRNHRVLLDHISVKIAEGENIAILGPNGAGKSSFIKTITREYYPVLGEGEVTFRSGAKTYGTYSISGQRSGLSQTTSSRHSPGI